ncbi:nicotinamidase [Candidatus Korarchaeum cryptofilum]|jgi:nicotinamidase/pyrazinamidase|uniref:nicotinamidase n=1 Tax=Candidatus Korarchaeum cryptofilum TaxID=498846 RepID=A0A3R9PCU5_9CREN|nr:nicotinamidase [Candidatus Korarchaeum cryptofilum]RSN67487.1 nicotinamidase [Candidatus Korarchaeum cryptofilum]
MRVAITDRSALLIVDVQRDFMPGGPLPVPDGDSVVKPLNDLIGRFESRGLPVILTRDWHPRDHISFKERGGPWPPHCVAGTEGAEFHKDLRIPRDSIIISKATERDKEAYSGFEGTDLDDVLRKRGVRRLFVGGVATEYCVRATVMDALSSGYEVLVVEEAIKGISPEDEERAKEEMVRKGAIIVKLDEIL